jgi:Ca-activated chloride channel family protein
MVMWAAPLTTGLLVALAEWLHLRRQRRLAYLAFGAPARPRNWVRLVPALRVLSMAGLCWGLLLLWWSDGSAWDSDAEAYGNESVHHVIIALDVSPSMHIEDAGSDGKQSRADRARDVIRSVLERLPSNRTRVSVVAFYSGARPVVLDTDDPNVVANVLNDLPLEHAFQPGKTNMYDGILRACEVARRWTPRSTSLILASDGDTLPASNVPVLPPSVANLLVVGVGDPHRGTVIDGHSSRQDTTSLRRLALQLRGTYFNGNTRHVPSETLQRMIAALPPVVRRTTQWKDWAVFIVVVCSGMLGFVSPLLAAFGAVTAEVATTRHAVSIERVFQ